MNLTPEEYNAILNRPAIKRANAANQTGSQAQAPQPECPVRHEPVAEKKRERSHAGRFHVSVEGRRVRLIDPDNATPKYFIDCCRYAGLIPDDRSQDIELSVTQTKVKTKEEECTVITIEKL